MLDLIIAYPPRRTGVGRIAGEQWSAAGLSPALLARGTTQPTWVHGSCSLPKESLSDCSQHRQTANQLQTHTTMLFSKAVEAGTQHRPDDEHHQAQARR